MKIWKEYCCFFNIVVFLQLLSLTLYLTLSSISVFSVLVSKINFASAVNSISDLNNTTSSISSSSFPSSSPSFGMQEIENTPHNWIDVWRGIPSNKGSNFTDIRSINYFSDGRFLNVTLWLDGFSPHPPTDRRVNYGMYIDSDFNNKTGIAGIDYKIEIQWNPTSKSWTRVFEEWSTNGKNKTLDVQQNYTGFYQKGGSFVNLYANLKDMIYPQKYRVLFYAEEIKLKGLIWLMDSPKWIYIPPPKFIISVNPYIVNVRAGEQKSIELQVKSPSGFQPLVHFYNGNSQIHSFIKFDFAYNKLQIPSIGETTTPLTISISSDAIRYPYTAVISADFSFPSQEFFAKPLITSNKIITPTENVSTQSTLTLTIGDPVSTLDIINDFWSKVGGFVNFVYLVGGAIASLIFTGYLKKRNKKRTRN